MAQGTYAPFVAFTLFDNDGILPGALLWTYVAGTTTLTPTFSDTGLTTPNSNPVVADAGGRMTVILAPGQAYKFIAQTPGGTEIWTRDNIISPTSATGVLGTAGVDIAAGQVVYLSDGSGGNTAGRWYLADADFVYASITPVIGMTPAAIASGDQGTVTVVGQVTDLAGLTPGSRAYVSQTAGQLIGTAPSPNVRIVGVADSATTLILTGGRPSDATMPTSVFAGVGGVVQVPIPAGSGPVTVIFDNPTPVQVLGFAAGVDGQQIQCYSRGAGQVDFYPENPSNPVPTTRLKTFVGSLAATSLAAGVGSATFQYDGVALRWRMVAHEQGAWIVAVFNAGDYTGNGTMTWTVENNDLITNRYYLSGRKLSLMMSIGPTTVGGTPNTQLIATIPGGYVTLAAPVFHFVSFNAGVPAMARGDANANQLYLSVNLGTTANWVPDAGTYVFLDVTIEVQ